MIPASEFRKIRAEKIVEKRRLLFIEACDKYRKLILEEVQIALKKELDDPDDDSKTSTFLDVTRLRRSICGYTFNEMLLGILNEDAGTFDLEVFTKFGISRPFDLAMQEVAKFGYSLTFTIDGDSNEIKIQLSWEEEDNEEMFSDDITIDGIKYLIDENGVVYNDDDYSQEEVGLYNRKEKKWIRKNTD